MSDPATPPPSPILSPKEQFLARTDHAASWRNVARSDILLTVLTYSFSEFCIQNTPSAEQIQAVRNFIHTTLNLAEPKKGEAPPFPDKRLTSTVEPTAREEKKK